MIKQILETYLKQALNQNQFSTDGEILIERCKNKNHGHFATNLALTLAKKEKTAPRVIAEKLISKLTHLPEIEKIEIAGAGFINFTLKQSYLNQMLKKAVDQKANFGKGKDKKTKVLLEFVSANPTGPLHIGHARGAAFGTVLANLLQFAGYQVIKEYYVNDAGRQMDILALSAWLRYLENGHIQSIQFPTNAYQGEYLKKIAANLGSNQQFSLAESQATDWKISWDQWHQEQLHSNSGVNQNSNDEQQLDALIAFSKHYLQSDWQLIKQFTLKSILDDIQSDLLEFGLEYQNYFNESELLKNNQVQATLKQLKENGHLIEKDRSVVFKSTEFGDTKDRVVVRSNGQYTYFATDIGYHLDKLKRADILINIWGADHHGYIPRMKAAIDAMGEDSQRLEVLLVQFVRLIQNKQLVSMSTRSGEFITLRDLRKDISQHLDDLGENFGNDTVRFFFVAKKLDQHMDFDWDLATSKTQDNPIIYLNYAYARIKSVLELSKKQAIEPNEKKLDLLTLEIEQDLIFNLLQYPDLIEKAALSRSPHLISFYLLDLVALFHSYYANTKFITEDLDLSAARLYLIDAIQLVIKNALNIFAINPKKRI